jgi:hypothetical protein
MNGVSHNDGCGSPAPCRETSACILRQAGITSIGNDCKQLPQTVVALCSDDAELRQMRVEFYGTDFQGWNTQALVPQGIANSPTGAATSEPVFGKQAARFGSRGEDFAVARRLH